MSSFFELNIASQGLYTARMGLNIANHNIANANAPGYSRQVIEQRASRPMPLNNGTGMLGSGAEVVSIARVRDVYLDQKYWNENVTSGEWEVKAKELSAIEALLNEPSDTGFSKVVNEFYTAMQEMSKNPGDLSYRQNVKQMGIQLTKYFNQTATTLQGMQRDIDFAVQNKVHEINSYSSQIATLNKQIYNLELDGNKANDLRDQRENLIDKLSKIVSINVSEVTLSETADSGDLYQKDRGRKNQQFVVTLGNGQTLVNHFDHRELELQQRDVKIHEGDIPNLNNVVWKDNGVKADIQGGQIKGYLDLRDENGQGNMETRGIPYYMQRLDRFVQNFAMAFNEGRVLDDNGNVKTPVFNEEGGHANGKTLDGLNGIRFFSFNESASSSLEATPEAYGKITALNFSMSKEVLRDVRNIAAGGNDGVGAPDDGKKLLQLIGMRYNNTMFTEGQPEDYMQSIISVLGVDNNQAKRISENQGNLLKEIDNQRESVKGVNLDEEMAGLVKYQQAYNAAAKILTTLDGIYDTTINKLGLVGR